MAKRKNITISDITFSTQSAGINYVRKLLIELEPQEYIDSTSPHWPFLSELLARHPEYDVKRGLGIAKFIIQRSAYGHIELHLERNDGSSSDVSWRICVTQRANTIIGNLKAAMRVEVDSQVDSYKDANFVAGMNCELCQENLIEQTDVHTDHIIHFDVLVENFLRDNPIYPQEFDDEILTNRAKFREVDSDFARKWFLYHREHALLRLVHGRCNLRRKKAI